MDHCQTSCARACQKTFKSHKTVRILSEQLCSNPAKRVLSKKHCNQIAGTLFFF